MSSVPVFVALIGSVAAGLVYVWQKSADRREKFRTEKQEAFRDYLRSFRDVVNAQMGLKAGTSDMGNLIEVVDRHNHITDTFDLYASEDIRKQAWEVDTALLSWREEMSKGDFEKSNLKPYLKARNELVNAMRHELFGNINKPLTTRAIDLYSQAIKVMRNSWAKVKGNKP